MTDEGSGTTEERNMTGEGGGTEEGNMTRERD